jgi:hypothetical protein
MPRPYLQEDMEAYLNQAAEEDQLGLVVNLIMSGIR